MNNFANFIFFVGSSIILIFAIGHRIGLSECENQEEILKTEIKIEVISDRITACEENGGKYSYSWSDYSEEYYERCYILSKRIEDF